MEFDLPDHFRAVERAVSASERDGQPARAITISRVLATTVENLWDTITNVERIPTWFAPIKGDLELGGRYQVQGNAGGVITACKRLSHFDITWEFAGDVSWVSVRLADEGEGSVRLTLTHASLLSNHWEEFGPGAGGIGWEMGLLGLSARLAHPTEPMPEPEAFFASSEAMTLIANSGEAWRQADIAAGTDPAVARAAAERSISFYSGTG